MIKMKSIRKKIIFPLSLLILFSLVIPFTHADNGTAEMSILPQSQVVYFNQNFTVDIVVNAENVSAVQCWVSFNASLLKAIKVTNGEMFDNLLMNGTIDNSNGTIKNIVGYSLTPVNASGGKVFATIKFQAKDKVGISSIELISGYCSALPYENLTLHNATVEVRNPLVNIAMLPSYNLIGNETTSMDVNITPNGNEITVFTCNITFDANYFEVIGVTNGGLFGVFDYSVNNSSGTINIFALVTDVNNPVTTNGTLATIEFKPKLTGLTNINLTDVQVYGVGQQLHYTTSNATLEADLNPPDISMQFGQPYYNDGIKNWISSYTPIYINATDEHDYTIYYCIWNGSWQSWTDGSINANVTIFLADEGKHYIEYYAKDNLNNTSPIYNRTVYVDNSPPDISKQYGKPYYNDGTNEWI
ncbi:MAG: hypothetical protein J7J36_03565, partial [Thermoplasmata archaeon]|nr:hypothetical protein [Thermoplasmata archaeon]